MAITSVGYGGSVTELGWSSLAPQLGARFSVIGPTSFQVSALSSPARAVRVRGGSAQGHGIFDVSGEEVVLQGTSTSATRWDTVALRRNWQNNTTTVVLVPGSSQRAISSGLESNPGVVVDQPLALVQFTSAPTPGAVVDVRCWHGNGGLWVRSQEALAYLEADIGTHVYVDSNKALYVREISSTGAPAWRNVIEGFLTQESGTISANTNWSSSMQWSKVGNVVTLRGRPLRTGSSLTGTNVRSPMYTLPAALRKPHNQIITAWRVSGGSTYQWPVIIYGSASTTNPNRVVVAATRTTPNLNSGWRIYFDTTYIV